METLDKHIAPDEPVLWRTPTLRGWALDLGKALALTAGIPVMLAMLVFDAGIVASSLIIPFLVLGYATKTFLRGPSEALLTGQLLLFQRRIIRPEIKTLARRDIVSLEIFAGDDVLVLHGKHGELHRATLLDVEMDLARELDLPTTLWTPYEPPKRTRRIEYALMVLWPFAMMGFMIAVTAALPDAFFEAVRTNLSEPARILAPIWIVLAMGGFSWPAATVLVGLVRRLVLPRTELNRIRCAKFTPLWRGKDPGTARTDGIMRKLRLRFDRAIYGPFPDCGDPEPERYEPGAFPPPDEDE